MDPSSRHGALAVLTVSLLPSWPLPPGLQRNRVEAEIISYVQRQVRRMPLFLRLPWLVVLLVFANACLFRHGRTFVALPPQRRKAWVRLWAESPLVPMRDFVRMVRSCALLAWFDHPLVCGALDSAEAGAPR